jgi:hypothetical protein
MKFANPFTRKGIWLKGNTHTHTIASDGKLTPAEIAESYARHGYDFVFLTDHWKRTQEESPNDVLLIAAEELDFQQKPDSHHIVCFGLKKEWKRRKFGSLNMLARHAKKKGAHLIIAHPYWSGVHSKTYSTIDGFLGVEVFNTVCDGIGRGLSAVHWDDMLGDGRRVFGFAADDMHTMTPGRMPGGWIMVKATAKTEKSIFEAITRGFFYSTQGPEIKDIHIRKNEVQFECSPCQRINFISTRARGKSFFAEGKTEITKASYSCPPDTVYVRIECVDKNGKTAWSNPIFF